MRLIAMFAMHLMGSERGRLKLFSFDEGWRLLGDPVGRSCSPRCSAWAARSWRCRSSRTQLVTDALVGERESLENLLGATFVFGMRSEAEAARALQLLGLDPEDRRMRQSLLEFEAGRCLLRDHSRAGRGDPGRRRAAVAAARVLDDARGRLTVARRRCARRGWRVRAAWRSLHVGLAACSRRAARRRPHRGPARRQQRRATPRRRTAHRGEQRRRRTTLSATHSAPAAKAAPAKGPAQAPSKPPLGSGAAGMTAEEEASASASPSGGDPLVDNGLGSPLCCERHAR